MKQSQTTPRPFLDSLKPVVLVLLLATFVRLVMLDSMPIFLDEALELGRSRNTFPNDIFLGIRMQRWLHVYLLALLKLNGPETLWVGRAVSAIGGVLSCAGCVALGRMLDSRKAGLLAGAIYAVLPFAIFHERQALADAPMSVFTMLTVVLAVRVTRKQTPFYALLLALVLVTGYLMKGIALAFFAIPIAAVVLLVPLGRQMLRPGLLAGAATALGYGLGKWVFAIARQAGRVPMSRQNLSADKFSAYIDVPFSEALANLGGEFSQYWEIMWVYFGPVMIALAIVSLYLIVRRRKPRQLLFMLVPALALALPAIVVKRPTVFLPSRFFTDIAAPFTVLAALAAVGLLRALADALAVTNSSRERWLQGAAALAVVLLVVWPIPHTAAIITSPLTARLQSMDSWQYVTSVVSGVGRSEAGEFLVQEWRDNGEERIAVVAASSTAQIRIYMGDRIAAYRTLDEFERNPEELGAWLAQDMRVYFVDETPLYPLEDSAYGTIWGEAISFPLADPDDSEIHVYHVTGADDAVREVIFQYKFIQPEDERVVDQYPALGEWLASDPTPRAVVVYPPNQLETVQALLADQPQLDVYAIGDSWPFDADEAREELENVSANYDIVEMVFLQETLGDPNQRIESWAADNLFFESETWFEPIRLMTYYTPPLEWSSAPLSLEEIDARFGEDIVLWAATILDAEVTPGSIVRVALVWRTDSFENSDYNVFTHIVDADGNLVAQHDGVPGGGLYRTHMWSPRLPPVNDNFIIALPPDLAPGEYTLRVGLYDPDTEIRLPLTEGQSSGPDYAEVGVIVVQAE